MSDLLWWLLLLRLVLWLCFRLLFPLQEEQELVEVESTGKCDKVESLEDPFELFTVVVTALRVQVLSEILDVKISFLLFVYGTEHTKQALFVALQIPEALKRFLHAHQVWE